MKSKLKPILLVDLYGDGLDLYLVKNRVGIKPLIRKWNKTQAETEIMFDEFCRANKIKIVKFDEIALPM